MNSKNICIYIFERERERETKHWSGFLKLITAVVQCLAEQCLAFCGKTAKLRVFGSYRCISVFS
jgi:hypothetical protein